MSSVPHLLRYSAAVLTWSWIACGSVLGEREPVVIHEIHYHPPQGTQLEFIELHNPSVLPVSVSGWSFSRGVNYLFPAGASIEPKGFLVVGADRASLGRYFGIPVEGILGDFGGTLDNGGETLELIDEEGDVVDSVQYGDAAPWPVAADGGGASLERICPTFASGNPGNWTALPGAVPTPLAPGPASQCPPPDLPPPIIAINEIYYHPLGDVDARLEFIELRSNAAVAVNLRGCAFTDGIDFLFTEDTILDPGGLVVVARDAEQMRSAFDVENVVGNFTGQLSNEGERVTLVDPAGNLLDSVRYGSTGDWPVAPDGLGYSLEKIVPSAISDDPASWSEAGLGDLNRWRHMTLSGTATSSKLLIYLESEGEFILDGFKLFDPANPDLNYLPNGSFDAGIESWEFMGNHSDSRWEPTGGTGGGGALHLISRGRGTGTTNGIVVATVPELERGQGPLQLDFDFRYVTGGKSLVCKMSLATPSRGIYWKFGTGVLATPGKPNTVESDRLPPHVSDFGRFPREPRSTDDGTWITARVRCQGAAANVKLVYVLDYVGEPVTLDMADDGAHGDLEPGDGIYGVGIPPQVHNTIVTFRIVAEDTVGAATWSPPDSDPTGSHGYYVSDLQPDSPLPTYTLLLSHQSKSLPRAILSSLNCATYATGAFAYRGDLYRGVGIRQRGQSVCGSTKPYLKVRFQLGRDFLGQHKLNLQSLWTDKSLVRELLAWGVFRDLGMPYCQGQHVRLHVNGKYFGLYGELEHPDHRFLERNQLPPDGNLYKAVASTEDPKANYAGSYEKKTNENGDFSDLTEFLNTMHATPRTKLVEFFSQRVDEDRLIDYQLGQTLTNNSDYPHKNHYLYHDSESGRWMSLTWDMDLTFGKIWDGTYGGVLHDKMHTPGNNPWYTTSVDGGLGNHLLDKFFSQAGTHYRRAYLVRLWDALQEKYTEAFFERQIAYLHDLLIDEQAEDLAAWGRSSATADDPSAPRDFEPNLDRVRAHIKSRRAYLLNYLVTRSRFTGHDRLKITEVMYNPPGTGDALEFVELWNPSGKDIDVSGWTIQGLEYTFPEGTTVADNEVIVLARDPEALSAQQAIPSRVLGPYAGDLANDGEILRVKDVGPGHPATVDFLWYGTRDDWAREAAGAGRSLELTEVAPARDNDLGEYWRASAESGGSPGFIEGIPRGPSRLRVGDPTADGKVNVTDALAVIRYLFAGSGEPPCLAAADINSDGIVEIRDAIELLVYLFRPGAADPPSPRPGTCVPTAGLLLPCGASICAP